MNKTQIRSLLKNLTEQKAPAAQIDLWPAIQSRIEMSQPAQRRGTRMNQQSDSQRRWLKPAFIFLVVALIGAYFLILPQGRALAQQILHFFTQGESNVMPGVTTTPMQWVEQTPGAAAATSTPQPPQPTPIAVAFEDACGTTNAPHCSIEDIRQRVAFPVFALAKIPDGMYFAGATGGPERIFIDYRAANGAGLLWIEEEPFTGAGNQLAGEVGAGAVIQSVQVGGETAEYVKGSYDGSSNPPVWNNAIDLQMLRWVNHGILFNLYLSGSELRLGREDMASLAAALTDGPVGANGLAAAGSATLTQTPAPTTDPHSLYPLTLAEAQVKAGFTLLTPSRLPENLEFIGAAYDEKTKVVQIAWTYHHPICPEAQGGSACSEAQGGLLVSEQLAPARVDCDLCGYVLGDGKQVDQYPMGKLVSKDAVIETVPIGDFTGTYVEGIGWTSWTDCCGWQWDPTPFRKRLRFQTHELAVEVWADLYDLNKADFIAIAEGLK